jgi:hypothetical protein
MKLTFGTLVFGALLAGGCGKSAGLKAIEEMADKVCACKDAECAQKVMTEAFAKNKDTKAKKSEEEALKKATMRAMECAAKMSAAGAAKPE